MYLTNHLFFLFTTINHTPLIQIVTSQLILPPLLTGYHIPHQMTHCSAPSDPIFKKIKTGIICGIWTKTNLCVGLMRFSMIGLGDSLIKMTKVLE